MNRGESGIFLWFYSTSLVVEFENIGLLNMGGISMRVEGTVFSATRRRFKGARRSATRTLSLGLAGALVMTMVALFVPSAASVSGASGKLKIGVDLTYNNTDFWSAYISYEQSFAKKDKVQLLGPLLSAASASLQNQQIEELVNEGAKA